MENNMKKIIFILISGLFFNFSSSRAENKGLLHQFFGSSDKTAALEHKQMLPIKGEEKTTYAPVVKKASPAVVSIASFQVTQQQRNPFFDDPFFRFFFEGDAVPRAQVERSLGSGVIVDPKGIVITCAHVVQRAEAIQLKLNDNREFTADVIHLDSKNDLAVLKIKDLENQELPYVSLGDSRSLEVGDLILAIGNPFGVGQTVTSGIISAVSRNFSGRILLQTDAPINPGNSGGGLFDLQGNLVAIPNAILSKTGASHGIGFAIPIAIVRPLVVAAQTNGKVIRPWSGVQVHPVSADVASSLGLTKPEGVLVQKIHRLSPAGKAGLKRSDIILQVNGKQVTTAEDFLLQLQESAVGDSLNIEVLRQGQKQTLKFSLIPPPAEPAADETVLSDDTPLAGIKIANLSPAIAAQYHLEEDAESGVVVTQGNKTSFGFRFQVGDVIEEINGQRVASVKHLKDLLPSSKQSFKMVVQRGDQHLVIEVR
jgi:Do/DeqQ family serine protease